MSGPKYSRGYVRDIKRLQAIQKDIEIQLEKRKCKQLQDDIKKSVEALQKICHDSEIRESQELLEEIEEVIPTSVNLYRFKEMLECIEEYSQGEPRVKGNSKELTLYKDKVDRDLLKVRNYVSCVKEIKPILVKEASDEIQKQKYKAFMTEAWEDTGERVEISSPTVMKAYHDVLELLSEMPDFENKKRLIDETIMKTGDDEYKRKQLEMRRKSILVEANCKQNNIELLNLQSELRGMYSLLGWEAKRIPISGDELRNAIEEAKQELKQRQISKYIATSIHKVLADKGYSLVEDSIVNQADHGVSKNYYEFGQKSLINVSTSDKGQILFEIVGNGTPQEWSASDTEMLVSEMRRFCPNYQEVKRILLREYGISLEDEHLCEPDAKYAKVLSVGDKGNQRRGKQDVKAKYFDA